MDDAGRGPRNAGLGLPQGRRRPADELPAGIGRRRRDARALFDHRSRSGPGLARQWRRGRDQPRRTVQSQQFRSLFRSAARFLARPAGREPHRITREAAAHGRRPIRLSRLRHGAADGGASSAEAGPDRHSRRNPHPPGPGHRVRYGRGHAHHRRAGAVGARNPREARA